MDNVFIFDDYDPLRRYEQLLMTDPYIGSDKMYFELTNIILLILYAFNDAIHKEFGDSYLYYLFDDKTISFILEQTQLHANFNSDQISYALILLDKAKLIYRFTCAKKFNIADSRIKQLRLNSWGREYITEHSNLVKNSERYKDISNFIFRYLRDNRTSYSMLLQELKSPLFPHNIELINKINSKLSIKILS